MRESLGTRAQTMERQAVAQLLKAGAAYFALVFGAGFALGSIRILWAVPRFGVRTAELTEAPIMLVATVLAARWIVRRFAVPHVPSRRLGVGLLTLVLMLLAELTFVQRVRGLTVAGYLAGGTPCRERCTSRCSGCLP